VIITILSSGLTWHWPELLKDWQVGISPVKGAEFGGNAPAELLVFDGPRLAFSDLAVERAEPDGGALVGPNDGFKCFSDLYKNAEFLHEFANKSRLWGLARVHFAARKLPEPSEVFSFRTLASKVTALPIPDDTTDDFDHGLSMRSWILAVNRGVPTKKRPGRMDQGA
jgi:hypothetical protein